MTRETIPLAEVSFLPSAQLDPNGRTFGWRGELFRVIPRGRAAFFRDLAERGVLMRLQAEGLLVASDVTNYSIHEGDLVLHHPVIPVVSYCYEWPPEMLKAAALLTLDLCLRLAEWDLTLQDAHPWNVLFRATQPVFVDAGSIVPCRPDILWAAYDQFCQLFLFPLYLYAAGRDRIARWLLHDRIDGVTAKDALSSLPVWRMLCSLRLISRLGLPRFLAGIFERLPDGVQARLLRFSATTHTKLASRRVRINFFARLRADVQRIRFSSRPGPWRTYYANEGRSIDRATILEPPQEWGRKQEAIRDILANLRPRTVTDLGCNIGNYTLLAAAFGARVIGCDTDAGSVSMLYERVKAQSLDIHPLVLDPFRPVPSYGGGGEITQSAADRLSSDLVMALALVHHVIRHQGLGIRPVVEACRAYARRWLLVEFVPSEPSRTPVALEYRVAVDGVEAFEKILYEQARHVAKFASHPEGRVLYLCTV